MAKVWRVSLTAIPAAGNTYQNTWHFVTDDIGLTGQASASDVLGAMDTSLYPKWRAVIRTDELVDKITVTQELAPGDTAIPDVAEKVYSTSGLRTASGFVQPLEMTALTRLITHVPKRGASGHFFNPPPKASILNSPPAVNMADAYGTAITQLAAALKEGMDGGHWWDGTSFTAKLVVYSRTRRARQEPNYWFDVKDVIVDSQWHWLRSRGH